MTQVTNNKIMKLNIYKYTYTNVIKTCKKVINYINYQIWNYGGNFYFGQYMIIYRQVYTYKKRLIFEK